MSLPRPLLAALALLLGAGCAGPRTAGHDKPLPPPALGRAGTRDTGAGPALGSPRTATSGAAASPAASVPHAAAVVRAIDAASGLVGQREIVVNGVRYGEGCEALVEAAYRAAGRPLPASVHGVASLLAHVRAHGQARRGRPEPGDLVFLSDRPGGPAEHVGLVESVSAEGTALVLHRTERGVARLRVNAAQPWKLRAESGRSLNDLLVVGGGRVPAGRLFVAYATVLR